MVKIVGKALEEKTKEEKLEALASITREMFGRLSVNRVAGAIFVNKFLILPILQISPYDNTIFVYKTRNFDDAVRLAQAYEAKTGKEFTVKKDY